MKALGAVTFAVVMAFVGGGLGYVFALNGADIRRIGAGNGNAFVLNRLNGNAPALHPYRMQPGPCRGPLVWVGTPSLISPWPTTRDYRALPASRIHTPQDLASVVADMKDGKP